MALIAEDGSAKIDSNTYVTIQEYRDYHANIGVDVTSEVDLDIEQRLIQATRYLQLQYEAHTKGIRTNDEQSLFFPRAYCSFFGTVIYSDQIHKNIKEAQIIAAKKRATLENGFYEDTQTTKDIKKTIDKVGTSGLETEVEYFGSQESQSTPQIITIAEVDQLMKPFLFPTGNRITTLPRSY